MKKEKIKIGDIINYNDKECVIIEIHPNYFPTADGYRFRERNAVRSMNSVNGTWTNVAGPNNFTLIERAPFRPTLSKKDLLWLMNESVLKYLSSGKKNISIPSISEKILNDFIKNKKNV